MNDVTTMEMRLTAESSGDMGLGPTLGAWLRRRQHDAVSRLADATSRGPTRGSKTFWMLQLAFWTAYGTILMLPWIGVWTIGSMLPNKVVIAGSGMLAGLVLRPALGAAESLGRRRGRWPTIVAAVVAVAVVGMAWDIALTALIGHSSQLDLQRFGSMAHVPQLAGGLYHVLVLAIWSMAWLLVREKPSEMPTTTIATNDDRIVLRDGRTTHVFGAGEIDLVQADGDYIVVNAGTRRFLIRATLGNTEKMLPAADYVRIHRSTIVRVAHVRDLHSRPNRELDVVLRDGTRLRASRTYSDRLRAVTLSSRA